jgi:hypothetical protein
MRVPKMLCKSFVQVFREEKVIGLYVLTLLKACMLITCLRRPACLVQAAGQSSLYTVKAPD